MLPTVDELVQRHDREHLDRPEHEHGALAARLEAPTEGGVQGRPAEAVEAGVDRQARTLNAKQAARCAQASENARRDLHANEARPKARKATLKRGQVRELGLKSRHLVRR